MALVAIEAHGEEKLRRVFHRQLRVAQHLVISSRRIFERGTRCRQDGVHEPVIGHVAGHGLANPIPQRQGSLFAQVLAIDLKQVGPLVGPVLHVVGTANEPVDHGFALDA